MFNDRIRDCKELHTCEDKFRRETLVIYSDSQEAGVLQIQRYSNCALLRNGLRVI